MDEKTKKLIASISEDALKVFTIMEKFNEELDMKVEMGLMNQHEARMEFYVKTIETLHEVIQNNEEKNEGTVPDSDPEPEAEADDTEEEESDGCEGDDQCHHGNVNIHIHLHDDSAE